jgi:predicted GNAT superfamily acetyltransferase
MTLGMDISIRPLKQWDEYLAAEQIQLTVWQMPDWRDVVPANLLITAHKNGGIVLGAFDSQDHLIGFAFSFIGIANHSGKKILKHCSHMLAVLPDYQGHKIGERLKFAQREIALAQNISLMTWTYDPLLALNANLNLVRLGTIARHYIVNAYGKMTDALNAGLDSDRFEVEWWMNAPRVQTRVNAPPPVSNWDTARQAGAQPLYQVEFDAQGLPRITHVNDCASEHILLEIPANLNAIKIADPTLAFDWRMQVRAACQKLFNAGFVAVDFIIDRATPRRAAYWLTRRPSQFGIEF